MSNEEEPMEVCSVNDIQPLLSSHDKPAENEDEVLLTLSLMWVKPNMPPKSKMTLEKLLQSWFNRRKDKADCSVIKASGDGSAVIKIKPVPALTELQTLSGQTLTNKEGKIIIRSVSLTPPNLKTQIPEDASMGAPPSHVSDLPQDDQMRVKEQNHFSSSAAVSTAGEETCTCLLPVGHFWYVSHIYKEEMERIARENGVKINGEVKVTFEADRKDGKPNNAFSDFINLVQKCLGESEGSIIPLKYIDPEEWRDTLKIIQKNENKLLLTLNSDKMIVCGPRQSQDLIKKSLNTSQKTLMDTSVGESTWASQDTAQKIDMSIKDPLADAGLTMKENLWRLLTTSFSEALAKIKAKFGVDFKESGIGQDKVIIKACYKKSGGNASMESHAVRALLHLYQKSVTSPMSFTQHYSGPAYNGATMAGGATAGDNKDENCPICLDTFSNKKQLKCKHEFCENCLAMSKESMGPICPLCKDVFGMIQGDQPDGKMSWTLDSSSLPGFGGCGHIIINYYIPGGKQTKKHPKPGEYYSSISRTAYLPDNNEGNEVLRLLKRAFDQKLIFTIGTSRTTGMENQVTWNDIHHKTSVTGGQQGFGYPDPGYLSRVREELKAKGIE